MVVNFVRDDQSLNNALSEETFFHRTEYTGARTNKQPRISRGTEWSTSPVITIGCSGYSLPTKDEKHGEAINLPGRGRDIEAPLSDERRWVCFL